MATQRCLVHPERNAFARCMKCTKTLCQECVTQWDGIWHCASCLTVRRAASVERSPAWAWVAVIVTSLAMLLAGARLMVWTAAVLAGLL